MLDYLRLDGTDLHDYRVANGERDVVRVEGLVGLPGPKGESSNVAEGHGKRNRNRWLDSKLVVVEGECWGNTLTDAYTMFDDVSDAFYRTLTDPAGKLLSWQHGNGGRALQALVKLAGPITPPLEEGAALLRYQAQVEQMDPRAYEQALSTVVGGALNATGGGLTFPLVFPLAFTESTGGAANVVNAGRVETPPIVRIYGPVTSPRYLLDGAPSGEQVKINGSIGSGDFLEVDHAKRTVKLNGTTLRSNLLDVPASRFFDVPKGAHEIRLVALNFGVGAHVEVDLRGAFVG